MKNHVPYIVYESAQARSERHIRRLVIALVIAIVLIFASNAVWVYAWCQYDYVGEDTEIVTTVDSEGDGIANYTGNNGGVNIGEGYGEKDNAHTRPDAPDGK